MVEFDALDACVRKRTSSHLSIEPNKRKIFCCGNSTSVGDKIHHGREMQQGTASIFEMARLKLGAAQELSDGCLQEAPNGCAQMVSAW